MRIQPRHLVWANFALLALVAYGAASTVSTAIAARLMPPPDLRLSAPPPPIEREGRRPTNYYAAISTRDVFNSAKPEPEKPKEAPKPTELKLKLWGVVVHSRDGGSYCVIEDLNTRKQELFRINDVVAGVARVKTVEWDRVILDRDGREEILELAQPAGVQGPGAAAGTAVAAARPAAGMPGGAPAGGAASGTKDPHVEQLGEFSYAVDKSEVDAALDNMNQLFTQIRAVPHFEGGTATGFRLFAIRQGSIFDKIGLKNGDILRGINGNPISDPSRALAMLGELRNQRELAVDIMRNKENKTLNYQVR